MKEIIKEADFRRQLKKSPAAGYLFFGDEDYLKGYAAGLLREEVCPDESMAVFNHIRISALDYSASKLLDAMYAPPMLSDRKLIELTGLDFNSLRADDLNALCEALALSDSLDYNVLLISVADGALDEGRLPKRPSALLSRLGEFLVPVRFEKCTPARLAGWALKHFEHNGAIASPDVCAEMISYCGRSMFSLAGEIDKVSFYVLSHGRTEVTHDDIMQAAIPDTDYDAFAFANALTDADKPRALEILRLMKLRRIDPIIIMSEVTRVFCDLISVKMLADDGLNATAIGEALKMHEYRAGIYLTAVADVAQPALRRTLTLCADADASLKLSPKGYTAIELLICSL